MNPNKPKRRPFFRFFKFVTRPFIRKPKIMNLGTSLEDGAIYLCNHVGATGPFTLEYYFPKNFRFWGTFQMTMGFRSRWSYMYRKEFPLIRHNNKFMSWIKASCVAPFAGMFYKGLQLIPTYTDARMKNTMQKSMDVLNKNGSIVLFPEDISTGYYDKLKSYFAGFWVLAKQYYKKFQKDIKIYNMYLKRQGRTLIIDKGISVKELLEKKLSNDEVAELFKDRANELATLV